jgi:GNAT superfamily N-acetyltransferase
MPVTISDATPADASAIGTLHASSWCSTYRGILPDAFLDGPVLADRQEQWENRFRLPRPDQIVLKAVDDLAVCGFACAFLDADATWGALLDNLHVLPGHTGQGIGQRLFDAVFSRIREARPGRPVHLWVIEANAGARRFYDRNSGRVVEQQELEIRPGLRVLSVRYAWFTAP